MLGLATGAAELFPLSTSELLLHGGLTVVKATLVMVGALGLSLLLRRSSAASRHALWTGTIVALLALPFLPAVTGSLPGIPVPVLEQPAPHPGGDPADSMASGIGFGLDSDAAGTPATGPAHDSTSDSAESMASGIGLGLGSHRAGPATSSRGADSDGSPTAAAAGGTGATEAAGAASARAVRWLLLAWAAGAIAFLLPLLLGLVRGRRLIRRALPLTGAEWQQALRWAAVRVGIKRRVPARLTPDATTAMAGGVLRPVVLLPEAATRWNAERRDLVLLHELVHVKRHDPARQILGRVTLALYWFHPLVWWVIRQASTAREEACDERVVALGQRPSTYARHLLHLTDPTPPALAGVTGFHHPDLEKRLMKILDPEPRSPRWRGLATGLLAGVWMVTVAALSPMGTENPPAVEVTEPSPTSVYVDTIDLPVPTPPVRPSPEPPVDPAPAPPAEPPAAPTPAAAPAPSPVAPQPPSTPLPPGHCPIEGAPERTADGLHTLHAPSDSLWSITTRIDGLTLCLHAEGRIQWDDEGARIRSMVPGASLTLSVAGDEGTQWLRITSGEAEGELEHRWLVGGQERPAGPDMLEWRDAHLAYMAVHASRARIQGEEARLRGEIARVQGETARLRGELARVQGEEARLVGERTRARSQEPRLQAEMARVQAEVVQTRSEIARLRSAQVRHQTERERTARRIAVLEEAREAVTDPDARAGLAAEIAALRDEMERIQDEIEATDVNEEVAALEARLLEEQERVEQRVAEIQAEIQALAQETDPEAMDEELARHRAENRERMEALQARIARQEEEARERIREIQTEIEALGTEERLQELASRMGDLADRLLAAVREAGFNGGGW